MSARRIASRIAVGMLPLGLAACVSYPFITDDGTTGAIDGSASVGNSNSNDVGTGTDPTNSNSSNQNSNTATGLPTTATGDVAQELCDGFIVISERDGSGELNVYAIIGDGSVADWSAGEDVGFDANSGALVNFNDESNVTAQIIGEYGGNTLFIRYNELAQSITLQNGSLWFYGPNDAEEVRRWHAGGDLITEVDVDSTHAVIVNRTRCTSVQGSSQ